MVFEKGGIGAKKFCISVCDLLWVSLELRFAVKLDLE